MNCGEECADPGVEMLLVKAGHDDALHAAIVLIIRLGEGAAAIDGYIVAVIGEARADLLGKTLEATVAIRNAAGTDDRNLQGRSPEASPCPAYSGSSPCAGGTMSMARGVLLNHQSNSRSGTWRRD